MRTNYYDRLFMADGAWREQKRIVDSLNAKYEDSQNWYRRGIVNDFCKSMDISHRIYEQLCDARHELNLIEDRIMSAERRQYKVYVIENYTDPLDDDYLISQIARNGYLTGFKF